MTKTIRFLLFFFLICLFTTCKKDNDLQKNSDGVITYISPNWKRSIHKNGSFSNSIIKRSHPVFGQKILIGTTEGDNDRWLNMIDVESGEDIWKWNDLYQPETEYYEFRNFHVQDDIMYYINGSRHYWINTITGKTVRKKRTDRSFKRLIGLDNTFFVTGAPFDTLEDYQTDVVYKGEFDSDKLIQILVPNLSLEHVLGNRIGGVDRINPFVYDSDTFLLISFYDLMPDWEVVSYLGLYNLSKQEWIYDKVKMNSPSQNGGTSHELVIEDDKVYATVGRNIVCHDLWTGYQRWSNSYPRDFLFSGFIVEEGKVIANCEDKNLYCLDANYGTKIWTGDGSGTSSKLKGRYLNGVVYFS